MSGIRDAGKIRGRERIAVLAALNVAFDLLDLQVQNSELSQTTDALQAQAAAQSAAMAEAQSAPGPQATLDWDEPRLQSVMQRLDAALAPAQAQTAAATPTSA